MISISENFFVESDGFFNFIYKIRSVLSKHKVYVSTLAILFFMKNSWTKSVFQLRVRNSWVEGREVKCFNAIVEREGPELYVL